MPENWPRGTVPFGFWREGLDQKDDEDGAGGRHQRHRHAPGACWRVLIGVVDDRHATEERKIVHERDEHAKAECAQSRHHAEQHSERAERQRRKAPVRVADEPFGARRRGRDIRRDRVIGGHGF
jgi:hypothetical protein